MGTAAAMALQQDENEFDALAYRDRAEAENEPRWVLFAGDVISAERKRELGTVDAGGDENPARTLVASRGYMRRLRLVPLVPWMERVAASEMPGHQMLQELTFAEEEAGAEAHLVSRQPQYGFKRGPGQDIPQLTQQDRAQVERKGVLEVAEMRGLTYKDTEAQKIQDLFFPKLDTVFVVESGVRRPMTVSESVERIAAVQAKHGSTSTIGKIANVFLQSCEMFRLWGTVRLEAENTLVRQGVMPGTGYVHSYSPLAQVLFPLLGLQPVSSFQGQQTASLDRLADAFSKNAGNDPVMAEILEEMRQQRVQQQAALEQNALLMQQNADMTQKLLNQFLADGKKK